MAYTISYFLLRVVWRYATEHQLHSQPDFLVSKYRSPALGVVVALVSVHGSAWNAVMKDVMILVVAVGLGIYLPMHYYGGYGPMFAAIEQAKPGVLTLPEKGMSASWLVSTVLLNALGFYMWPHAFASAYTAKSPDTFRKNAVIMPLYQLVLMFVFFVGFAAILQVPGLTGAQADLSLLRICKQTFSPLMVGFIGAAGLLTALVPGSMILLSAARILAKNVYGALVPATPEDHVSGLARMLVPAVALLAVWFTQHGGDALVPLLLLGYNLVTQLFPAVMLSLPEQPLATGAGAMAGIVTGVGTIAYTSLTRTTFAKLFPTWPSGVTDVNIGVVAMVLNVVVLVVVLVVVSAGTRARATESDRALA